MRKKRRRPALDGMLVATFLVTIFYASTYPYIHKTIMAHVSDGVIAANQIINCTSLVIFGTLWNKKPDTLFKYYPVYCVLETAFGFCSTAYAVITDNIVAYYIIDTLIFSIVTRNICCGGIKLRSLRYNKEERAEFDNNDNSVAAVATIIGSVIAMLLDLNFAAMLWIATFGNAIDNAFYLAIYRNTVRNSINS